jgi:NADPH:quinone reductase-like Zn-dependent oxidoreductase
MKAVFFEEFGGPEVLQVATLPEPELVEGHLLIDVHCAGVNPIDWKARRGVYTKIFEHQFPIVAGFDYAGTVRAVGEGVSGFAVGDRVNGMNLGSTLRHGTYAEVDLGADIAIDFESGDFVQAAREHFPEGLDLVVDMIGGETLVRGYETLRKGGRMALLVGQPDPSLDVKFGVHSEFVFTVSNAERLSELSVMLARGAIKRPETKTMALEDAPKAQSESEAGKVRGKLVLKVR